MKKINWLKIGVAVTLCLFVLSVIYFSLKLEEKRIESNLKTEQLILAVNTKNLEILKLDERTFPHARAFLKTAIRLQNGRIKKW